MRSDGGRGSGATPLHVPSPPHVLREYAILADGERGAVLGPRGDVAWLCFPTWESPSVFNGLMGGVASYELHPDEPFVWGGSYEDGTLIWRDRWTTSSGAVIECREALAFPGDKERAILLRQVECLEVGSNVAVELRPSGDYGAAPFTGWRRHRGFLTARSGGVHLRWSGSPIEASVLQGRPSVARLLLTLAPGERHDLVLELATGPFAEPPPDPATCWLATESTWRRHMPAFASTAAPHDARHSFNVLRGLTAADGGTVAAVTTSLPERAGAGRNYDYRYVWVRDQCFVGQAAAAVAEMADGGAASLLDASVAFVAARLLDDGPALRPAYTADGNPVPDERRIDLPGYPGGTAVVGNRAGAQFQLDAFGESLGLFASAARADRLDAEGWRAAEVAVEAVATQWERADAGVWELEDRVWTHSRLTCVAGLRAVAEAGAPRALVGSWTALADQILADTARRCVHPSGRWQRAADDDRVDAALILPAARRATGPADPRALATLEAVMEELTDQGYVYRFQQDQRPLGEAEGAFALCGFALAVALLERGQLAEAVRWFERGRAATGPARLFTEEFDVGQHQLRGNLPQAFVHAMFLASSAAVGRALPGPADANEPG